MENRAVFLDFDGVLVESIDIKTRAFRALFENQARDVLAKIMAYHPDNTGISRVVKISHCYSHFFKSQLTDEKLAELADQYAAKVETAVIAAPWVDGSEDFFERHTRQMPLFVVSGTPAAEMLRIVEARQMSRWLTAVRGSPARKTAIARSRCRKG